MIGLEEKNSVLFQYTKKMTSDLLEEIKLLRDVSLTHHSGNFALVRSSELYRLQEDRQEALQEDP